MELSQAGLSLIGLRSNMALEDQPERAALIPLGPDPSFPLLKSGDNP